MKIYTRKGDEGKTSLIGGDRVHKDHIRIEAYGTVDELNSWIGLIRDLTKIPEIQTLLTDIQDRLFTIGSLLAATPDSKMKLPELHDSDVKRLEEAIDAMEASLEPMKSFILPGGHPLVSQCHIVRCVCRRAERRVVTMALTEELNALIPAYLNRLSDYLFVLSRYFGAQLQATEIPWTPKM